MRTARARTSGANLFVVLLISAPLSQKLEPPANPARFIAWVKTEFKTPLDDGGPKVKFDIKLYEVRCATKQSRELSSTAYYTDGGNKSDRLVADYEYAVPDTVGEMIIDAACHYAPQSVRRRR
ncbi:surface-adhesin E family protein [Novosphingobium terrae]|uniref:surface-adhesin E family protein n=1 Tax=Novosphingobium terrae TaxID=2726189 RepID=UPI003899C8D4